MKRKTLVGENSYFIQKKLGNRVKIRVIDANKMNRTIDFELVSKCENDTVEDTLDDENFE